MGPRKESEGSEETKTKIANSATIQTQKINSAMNAAEAKNLTDFHLTWTVFQVCQRWSMKNEVTSKKQEAMKKNMTKHGRNGIYIQVVAIWHLCMPCH